MIAKRTAFSDVPRDVRFIQFGTTEGAWFTFELVLDALVHSSRVPCQVVALIGGVVTFGVVTLELWFCFVVNPSFVHLHLGTVSKRVRALVALEC